MDSEVALSWTFAQTPEALWRFWTTPELVLRWFGSDPAGLGISARIDPVVGGSYEIAFRNGDGTEHTCFGRYTLVDPPRRLEFTWAWTTRPDSVERVSLGFEVRGEGTEMCFFHRDIDPLTTHGYRDGWSSTFRKLEAALSQADR